ncbi:DUF3895 domain-containing protein [Ammoniphilus sp. CFH 90114]|uniref:DUF3895 domain-containing protein n=1 Tax=Ammoniphilus sp. CFH 90114 TaxID=2493665 RepID=UPI00100EBF4F|nr:DUF3895 domain-containing protein [Ammoniphilus sp. CFH 90114]RXT03597.1 DUF3895 domain-containing protein [Ammoniphilus sp. CFH 90114]
MADITEQLSLFGGEEEPRTKKEEKVKVVEKPQLPKVEVVADSKQTFLQPHYSSRVDHLLDEGITSAREMAEKLIKQFGATEDRYLSGKPRLYASVCRYLDHRSDIKIVESKEDKSDRVYERIVTNR